MTPTTTRRRALGLALAAVTAVALAACSSGSSSGGTATSAAATSASGDAIATVDTMYGPVQVKKPADGDLTVVTLGWSDAEAALALGVKPVGVYDWLGFGEKTKGVGPWAVDTFGSVTPTVMKNVDQTFNYEQIRSLKPDVILNVNAAPNKDAFDRLSQIAPTIFAPTGTQAFAVGWEKQTKVIAQALGKSAEGDEVVESVEKQISDAKAANPEFAGKSAVSGSKFGDAYGLYLAGDFRADLLTDLGFTFPKEQADKLKSQGFFANVPAEDIAVLDQDVLVLFPIGFTLQQTQDDELVTSLEVVKAGRAVILDPASTEYLAFSASSPLSIPEALEEVVPKLKAAAAKPTS